MLGHASLLGIIDYDPETGRFTWKRTRRGRFAKAGETAGNIRKDGYRGIVISGRRYLAHRLAWFYMTGDWPALEVDHIDTDRDNNRWSNLREATRSQNNANERLRGCNTSGVKGVSYYHPTKRWRVQIQKDRKKRSLGYFKTLEEAHAVYLAEAKRLFGEYARVVEKTGA